MRTAHLITFAGSFVLSVAVNRADGLDTTPQTNARAAIQRGISYLRKTQSDDGSWSPGPGPAITALIVRAMLDQPQITADDAHVARGVAYILTKRREDGSFHNGFLQNYNTAICLSALSALPDQPSVTEAIHGAQDFLRNLQWSGQSDAQDRVVGQSHPFFGGAGYGKHGRPDLSNTQVMLQGLHDSGLSVDDPAFRRAVCFIGRCQGSVHNDMFANEIVTDGGFIYATSVSEQLVGIPQSMANPQMIDEAKAGRPVSGLRTYGSMTYAGFKSYIYAGLGRDDPRVKEAYDWIRRHYTLEYNPGLPQTLKMQGYYYYLMTFARALRASGDHQITTDDGRPHAWPAELIDRLGSLQKPDGSWLNEADRWLEGDPNLVTAYALIALNNAAVASEERAAEPSDEKRD